MRNRKSRSLMVCLLDGVTRHSNSWWEAARAPTVLINTSMRMILLRLHARIIAQARREGSLVCRLKKGSIGAGRWLHFLQDKGHAPARYRRNAGQYYSQLAKAAAASGRRQQAPPGGTWPACACGGIRQPCHCLAAAATDARGSHIRAAPEALRDWWGGGRRGAE